MEFPNTIQNAVLWANAICTTTGWRRNPPGAVIRRQRSHVSVGFSQHDLLVVLRRDKPDWRIQHLHDGRPMTAFSSAVTGVLPAAHSLELPLGVVTEVTVQLPVLRQIRSGWRMGLRGNGNARCSPGGDDDRHASQ